MKAVLLSLGLLFTTAAFAAYETRTEDVTGGAYEATTGATGGLGTTMGGAGDITGVYGRDFTGRGRAGDFMGGAMNGWRRKQPKQTGTQMGTQNDFTANGYATDASDITY